MRITIDDQNGEGYNTIVSVETPAQDIWEVADLLKQALLALGFHPVSVESIFVKEEDRDDDQG